MPPKKKEEEKKVLLGRPGNSLKSGIVRMTRPHTCPSSVLLSSCHSTGRLSQCGQIDTLPGHYKMLIGQPSRESTVKDRTRQMAHTAEYRTFHMLQLTLKKLVSLYLMIDTIGCVSSTSRSRKYLQI